jgi:predicted O-methyltransferase YrrM
MSTFSHLSVRPLQSLWQGLRGRRDAQQLVELGLFGDEFEVQRHHAARALQAAYERYIASVSTETMAVSWKTACLLHALACVRKPRQILDLGSGFSSYVLRSYAAQADHDCQVTSVDDNQHWLKQTEAYLSQHGLSTERLVHWDDFSQSIPVGRFDLVFHDMGNMATRGFALPTILSGLTPQGVLVLDDMHKRRYRNRAHRETARDGWQVFSARSCTLDAIGRFSEIAIRRSA